MPKEFDDILDGIKNSNRGKMNPRTKKPYSESEMYAMATDAYKKKYGKNPMHGKESAPSDFLVEYFAPFRIVEATKTDSKPKFLHIYGTAVDESISDNGIKYLAEELEKAAPSLSDRPILKDHKNEVDSIVGRTTTAWYSKEGKKVDFEGDIMDAKTIEMIEDGRIKNVSIGAKVNKMVRENPNDGNSPIIPYGISFREISVVPVQGVKNGTITQAIYESFKKGGEQMGEEKSPVEETIVVPENSEVKAIAENYKTAIKEVEQLKAELKEELKLLKETKEKPQGKGIVSTTTKEFAPRDEFIREHDANGTNFYAIYPELIYGNRGKR